MKVMFWIGLLSGIFIGGFVGVATMCIISVNK